MPGTYQHTIELDLDIDNIDAVSFPNEFQDIANAINDEISDMLGKIEYASKAIIPTAAQWSKEFQQRAIVENDSIITGALTNSININAGENSATIGTGIFYAEYVHDGRGPVYAKNKKVLHFVTKNGVEVFTKSVGPAAPRPWLNTSSSMLEKKLDEIISDVLEVI